MITFVVTFILGIVFEYFLGLGWSIGVLTTLISLVLFFYFKKEEFPIGKIILIVGIGFGLGVLRMSFFANSPDQELFKLIDQKIYFEATVSEEPDVRDDSTRYTVNLVDYKSSVLLVADRFPEFNYGDKIKVSGRLDLPKNFTSDNGTEFDYVSFLAKDKINFLIYDPNIEQIEGYGGNKIVASLYALKNIFIKNISAVVPEPNSSFLSGVIFGTKQSLGEALLNDFKKVGLIHMVVLSGYNITIIAIGVFYVTAFLNRRNLSFILSIIFIVLFATMVGWGATVVRAVIMALIAILARFLGRPADALRWLFIAGLLMLIWNPLILFYDPSFQLSFMATLGLILFSQFIFNFISERKLAKYIPTKFGLREIVASTLAVQFFVLPLLIKMSGFVSLISFLINPIVLPLVPAVMGFGALTGAIGLLPWVGQILSWPFGVASYFLTQIIISLTEFSANIPFATLQTGSISLWLILIWYLAYGFLYWKFVKNKFIL
ncbi:MAG: ComEC/Rec2 family competence protein [Candidatus Paceibacterota bacterium]